MFFVGVVVNQEFKVVTLAGKEFKGDGSRTILASAAESGLVFEYSCKTGQCGVCKTTLLQGRVKELQPQIALSDDDAVNNKMLTCCCAPVADILIDAEDLSALHGIETKTLPARINSIKKLTSDLIEVTLRLPPTANFHFLEGQYLDVIHNGIRRSYSIASTSAQKEISLLIKRFDNGKMSNYWFSCAKANDLLRIEGPCGTFYLRDSSVSLIFLATGTGIAPIMAILKKLDAQPFQQQNSIKVFWGNRLSEDFAWDFEFSHLNVEVVKVISSVSNTTEFKEGYVQDVALKTLESLKEVSVYACGSNAMIQSAKQKFVEAGLPENRFYSDAFVQSY